jgi:hypothetical protein
MCKTCIFGRKSPISQVRFEQLREEWAVEDVIQSCHQSNIDGGNAGCRGHYEAAWRGDIPHPVQGIGEAMGLEDLSTAQLMELFESQGFIVFVDEG